MMFDSLKKLFKFKMTETTHDALSASIILAQCFGLMPVCGIFDSDYQKLRFKYMSLRFAYAVIYLMLLFINISFYTAMICENGITFGYIVTFLFFGCSFVTSLFFMILANQWPNIMNKWVEIENSMKINYGFPVGLRTRLHFITIVVIGAAAVEHSFYLIFAITNSPTANSEHTSIDIFFQNNFRHVFTYVNYSIIIGLIAQAVNLFSTFSWNFMDVFIMLISTALAARFTQVKKRIEDAAKNKIDDINYWMEIREDYNKLNTLSKMLDNSLSNIILLSFSNNLFVILVQLLHSLEHNSERSVMDRLYFVYSFGFLLLRTSSVSLFASKIHVESTEPANTLSQLPADIYNDEIERILYQIKIDPSYFSGRGLFTVRKSLILSIAGAIVSYELIFIQFNSR